MLIRPSRILTGVICRRQNVRSASSLCQLPTKVPIAITPLQKSQAVTNWVSTSDITVPRGHIDHGERRFSWQQSPRNVLLLKKMNDDKVDASLDTVIEHVRDVYPEVNLIVEESVYEQTSSRYPFLTPLRQDEAAILAEKTDFVITLGGDGSILHASSLFNQTAVPPILSFSMGTLGFLLPYNIESYQEALKDVFESRFHLLLRMRMSMTLWDGRTDQQLWLDEPRKCHEMHFLNEMVLHRGSEPHMTTMDAFVNGEHLTRTIADGLIVSTPTGSTAYSLSAGGPIVHPTVSTMMLTPISPRSLSFRTILLPSDATLEISVSKDARAPAEVSVDGHIVRCLSPNQSVSVEVSPYPMPCIDFPPDQAAKRRCGSSSLQQEPDVVHDDWVHDINNLLRFNASFLSRGRDQDTIEKDRSSVSSRRRWERRQHMRQAEITGSDSR